MIACACGGVLEFLNQAAARGGIRRFGNFAVARGKELLLLQLDTLPWWITQYNIKPAFGEDIGKLELPVKDASLSGNRANCLYHWRVR